MGRNFWAIQPLASACASVSRIARSCGMMSGETGAGAARGSAAASERVGLGRRSGPGLAQTLTVYGRVPAQSTPSPGTYADTVVMTICY